MRTQVVITNLSCNHHCTYCNRRASVEDPSFVGSVAVRRRIDVAVGSGATEVVLSGGEPAMRRDLVALVRYARERGATTVVLETNGALVDASRASELAAAGLTRARVNLSGWGPELDAVTRTEGAFEATIEGIRALLDASVEVEIAVAVVRSTVPLLSTLPASLQERLGERAIAGFLVTVPVDGPDPEELLAYEDVAPPIAALERAARRCAIPLKLAAGSGPPPCAFEPRARPPHIYSLTRGGANAQGFARIDACRECNVADRCPGIHEAYLARHPAPHAHPVTEERARRRLSLISSVDQQIERELVTDNLFRRPDGSIGLGRIIRVNFQCNQSCRFCFVSTHLPAATHERVTRAITEAAAADAKISLSGGEPTLNARLVEHVELASRLSARPVQIQTNAIRLESVDMTRALVDAGLDEAFVSLHGCTAAISDAVTSAPGTFERTLLGLDNLYRLGVKVILNFVICERNMHELTGWVRLIADRWPDAFGAISFVAGSTDVVPRDAEMIPRYSDALPHLAAAVVEAERLGVELGGFESMCGIPLCLVPADISRHVYAEDLPADFDGGEFVRPPACERCSIRTRCYGLRRGYAEMHGTDELRPVLGDA